jgi:hypothetical protein
MVVVVEMERTVYQKVFIYMGKGWNLDYVMVCDMESKGNEGIKDDS